LGDELAALAAASLIKAKGKGSKAAAAAAEGKGKERKGGKPLGSYPGLTGERAGLGRGWGGDTRRRG
jgi:hypothetical protein